CYSQLSASEGISFGISALQLNGLIFRMLGYKAEQLFDLNNLIADIIKERRFKSFNTSKQAAPNQIV
ncbi:MAG: hypothetical protein ABI683_10975, partial [Ginsengibacter sp.]